MVLFMTLVLVWWRPAPRPGDAPLNRRPTCQADAAAAGERYQLFQPPGRKGRSRSLRRPGTRASAPGQGMLLDPVPFDDDPALRVSFDIQSTARHQACAFSAATWQRNGRERRAAARRRPVSGRPTRFSSPRIHRRPSQCRTGGRPRNCARKMIDPGGPHSPGWCGGGMSVARKEKGGCVAAPASFMASSAGQRRSTGT